MILSKNLSNGQFRPLTDLSKVLSNTCPISRVNLSNILSKIVLPRMPVGLDTAPL